jgi:hypothetical protein
MNIFDSLDREMIQVIVSSIVTLLVAIVGIISTCVAAKSAAKCEMKKAIILRFVEMFETTIQGLSTVINIYENFQVLISTVMSKEALALRVLAIFEHCKDCLEAGKKTDPGIYLLNAYFPDAEHESFDSSLATSAMNKLIAYIVETDKRMKSEERTTVTDDEYARYQELEHTVSVEIKPLQEFYNARLKYFIRSYSTWRKKNMSFLKGV